MLIEFACEFCGKRFQKDVSLAGKKGRCKDCGHVFVIPRATPQSNAGLAKGTGQGVDARGTSLASSPRPERPGSARPESPRPKPTAARPAATPWVDDAVDDPYGLDDAPADPKPAQAAFGDEEVTIPRRPVAFPARSKKKKKRSASGPNPGIPLFDGLPGFVYLIVIGVIGLGFALTLVSRDAGGYVIMAGLVLVLLMLLYGCVGLVVVPFQESLYHGITCMLIPPFLLGYLFGRWDAMKGSFLACLASLGMSLFLAVALPAAAGNNPGMRRMAGPPQATAKGPVFADGTPVPTAGPSLPLRGMPPAGMLPPGIQPPTMANSITLVVTGRGSAKQQGVRRQPRGVGQEGLPWRLSGLQLGQRRAEHLLDLDGQAPWTSRRSRIRSPGPRSPAPPGRPSRLTQPRLEQNEANHPSRTRPGTGD